MGGWRGLPVDDARYSFRIIGVHKYIIRVEVVVPDDACI